MSRKRALDTKLTLYHDLNDILGAMRSFALAELRRVATREKAQTQTASIMLNSFSDMAPHIPVPEQISSDIFVLVGSVHGFCASYNEDVLAFWHSHKEAADSPIVIGERLASLFSEEEKVIFVPGAINSNDVIPVIDHVLSAYSQAARRTDLSLGLVIVLRDSDGVITKRLWPMQPEPANQQEEIPYTHESPKQVVSKLAQHCLFHMLLSFLLRALHTENHMRLMQMENAMRHIDENSAALLIQRNRIRQEEIVNEIELILMERKSA